MNFKQILARQYTTRYKNLDVDRNTIEKIFFDLNKEVKWYKPWAYITKIKELIKAIIILGGVTTSCLSILLKIQENQMQLLDMHSSLEKRINELEE